MLATANQRPVTAAYPYYIGTSADFFDPGYRAATINAALNRRPAPLTAGGFAAIQASLTDQLAVRVLPALLTALKGSSFTSAEHSAFQLLATWNASMESDSAAATVWWTFWSDYLSAVFQPWWDHRHVPVSTDSDGLKVTVENQPAWTKTWRRGPKAAGGDPFTPDAADGGLTATSGPSWRMSVTFPPGAGADLRAEGVHPGGQDENPASPWYDTWSRCGGTASTCRCPNPARPPARCGGR